MSSERANPFGSFALHGHRGTDRVGESLLHLVATRRQLGAIKNDGAVGIDRLPARRSNVGDSTSEQIDTVGARERRIGVGKVLSDVSKARRTQQRIGNGVGNDVSVGVASETRP